MDRNTYQLFGLEQGSPTDAYELDTAANGVMTSRALYEPPFVGLHDGGPEGLFEGIEKVIDGIFDAIKNTEPVVTDAVG